MSHDGRAIANFVLDFCDEKGREVSNLALQKIVYFCHVWALIDLRKPLIRHSFEAWEFGPVLPYLYREFKDADRRPIKARSRGIDPVDGVARIVEYHFDSETRALLERVVDFYSRLRPGDLVALSHADDGPWHRVWNHSGVVRPGMKIDNESIARYYSKASRPFLIQ